MRSGKAIYNNVFTLAALLVIKIHGAIKGGDSKGGLDMKMFSITDERYLRHGSKKHVKKNS